MNRILAAAKRLLFGSNAKQKNSAAYTRKKPKHQAKPTQAETNTATGLEPEQVAVKFYQSALGQLHLERELDKPYQQLLQQLEKKFQDEKQLSQYAPRLPHVVPQLMRSLRDPDSSAAQQAEIISQDPVVAASVLRVANSPLFNASRTPIDSFQRAIVALGSNGVRSILSTAVMQPIMQTNNKHYSEFGHHIWNHALSTAVCAQLLAPQLRQDPFQAYLAGLIHDIGASTIFIQLMNQEDNRQAPNPDVLYHAINKYGSGISTKLAQLWDFDKNIVQALKELEHASQKKSELGQVLCLSSRLCQAYDLWQHNLLSRDQAEALLHHYHQPANRFDQLKQLLAEAA